MNDKAYRLVYSKLRGMLIAVEETATGEGTANQGEVVRTRGAPGGTRRLLLVPFRHIALTVLLVACLAPAVVKAQIIADPNAGAHRPTVISTANGIEQVNIMAPSAAGVSRNAYTQFDVPQAGIVLNNSDTIVSTRQAGYIDGNPNLASGQSARIILNEVDSALPSQLLGYIEVAGSPAEVVVANESGIVVDGGGFINTTRGVLTTGSPSFGVNGELTLNSGGNLNIASVQDTATSSAHQTSTGGGFSISQGGGSASFSQTNGRASGSFASVNEQAGIQAGADGFDIKVKGNTDLKGAKIASTADASKNSLTTNTLTFSDIANNSSYDAKSDGLSAGASMGSPDKAVGPASVPDSGGVTPFLSQYDNGSDGATTRSSVAAGTIRVTDATHQTQDLPSLNRDTLGMKDTVAKTPDINDLLNDQSDVMTAANAAGEAIAHQIGDYADSKRIESEAAGDIVGVRTWDESGANRVGLHVLGGALAAGLGGGSIGSAMQGSAGAGVAAWAARDLNLLANGTRDGLGGGDAAQMAGNVAANILVDGLGGLIGGPTGAFTAGNADLYNRGTGNGNGQGSTQNSVKERVWNAIASTASDPLGALNHALNSIIPAPQGQQPDADPNPLVQANDNGKPPTTGGAVVTPAAVVCLPNIGCAMVPGAATPGTAGHVPGNAILSNGGGSSSDQTATGLEPTSPVSNPDGAARAAKNSGNWSSGSLSETVAQIAGSKPKISYTDSGKTVYTNPDTGKSVVYDNAGNYYRVLDASGQYLDKSGTPLPNNVPMIGQNKTTQTGIPSSLRQALTHYKNTDTE